MSHIYLLHSSDQCLTRSPCQTKMANNVADITVAHLMKDTIPIGAKTSLQRAVSTLSATQPEWGPYMAQSLPSAEVSDTSPIPSVPNPDRDWR